MDYRDSRVRFPVGTGTFSLYHRVQNGSGAHPASYPMGTWGSFPGGKAAGAWSWPLTSNSYRGQTMNGAIPPLPHTPSRGSSQLKKVQGQLYLLQSTVYKNNTVVVSLWQCYWLYTNVTLTTHLRLLSRLRMCGAIPALHQYIFMAWCLIKQWRHYYTLTFTFTFTFTISLYDEPSLTEWRQLVYVCLHWTDTKWSKCHLYPLNSFVDGTYGGRQELPIISSFHTYEGASKSFRTGRLEQGLQMVQLSASRCSCIAILRVSLVSFIAIAICIASQRVFIVVSV
jgi:hypothetical protein